MDEDEIRDDAIFRAWKKRWEFEIYRAAAEIAGGVAASFTKELIKQSAASNKEDDPFVPLYKFAHKAALELFDMHMKWLAESDETDETNDSTETPVAT